MSKNPHQKPEGALIDAARIRQNISVRRAGPLAGITEGRWRQLVKGYQSAGRGQVIDVTIIPETLARMANAVGVTADQLRGVGREDAAVELEAIVASSSPGDEIRRVRLARGWSESEMARALRVGPKAISEWERGEQVPPNRLALLRELFSDAEVLQVAAQVIAERDIGSGG